MQESIVFLVRVQCRRKESSRSLSHLLMSFLLRMDVALFEQDVNYFTECHRGITQPQLRPTTSMRALKYPHLPSAAGGGLTYKTGHILNVLNSFVCYFFKYFNSAISYRK